MAVKGITVDTAAAASPHIYAYDQAIINNAIIGGDAVHEMFNNLLATKVSNNIVTISPGAFSIQGHFAYVQYGTTESMTIENGTAGQKRNDLICAKFKRTTDTDVISLVVVKGTNSATTPVDPAVTQQDLLTGGTERLFPLWRVSLDGINITTLTRLFTVQKNLNVFKDSLGAKKVGIFTVQDIGSVRTVNCSYDVTVSGFTYSATSNVYFKNDLIILPSGAIISTNFSPEVSMTCADILSVQVSSYNPATGTVGLYIYSHADLGTRTATFNFKATGGI